MGISHKTSPVAMRERLAFTKVGLDKALMQLHQRWPEAEFLLLSTCNRTELYTARTLHGHPREEELLGWLGDFHSMDTSQFRRAVYHRTDAEAVDQLFSVAAGLESMVLGEAQIVQQVKSALASAQQA
jgi:glutamyl-tRNA reductase